MKILITGASGFIGSNLMNFLSNRHNVWGTSTRSFDLPNFIKVDFLDNNSPRLITNAYDVIIHCASILATNSNYKNLDLLFDNLNITRSLVSVINNVKPKLFVNLSTIGVYPNRTGIYDENATVRPSDNFEGLYGLSKFSSEEIFSFYFKEGNTRIVNLRLGQTIGLGMRKDRVYSMMKEELDLTNQISVFGNGRRSSSFLTIGYLNRSITAIIDNKDIKGTYNLTEFNTSYLDLAKRIIGEFGDSNSEIIYIPNDSNEEVIIDSGKIKNKF